MEVLAEGIRSLGCVLKGILGGRSLTVCLPGYYEEQGVSAVCSACTHCTATGPEQPMLESSETMSQKKTTHVLSFTLTHLRYFFRVTED